MTPLRRSKYVLRIAMICAITGLSFADRMKAAELTLHAAEQQAIERDLRSPAARAQAAGYRESAQRAALFSDPQLVLGYEDGYTMEEYLVGLRQEIPRLRNLELRQAVQLKMAAGEDARTQATIRSVRREVRMSWLDVWYQVQAVQVIDHHVSILQQLVATARERFATGSFSQQEVAMLEVEERMQRERLLAARESEETARASLARLIGATAVTSRLPDELPELPSLLPLDTTHRLLPSHPAVLAAQSRSEAENDQAELAGQRFNGVMVDLLYGRNDARENKYGIMLSVPLPIFPSERQDRDAAAGRYRAEAARYERDDLLRTMASELDAHQRRYERQQERLNLYASDILPQSRLAAEATVAGYQYRTEDFLNVMRAVVYDLENRLGELKLRAEHAGTHAALLYFQEG